MCASNTMNGDVVSLVDVEKGLVECFTKIMVSVGNMTEVARYPFGLRRDVEGEGFGAVVGDLGWVVWVASGSEACDNERNLGEL